MTSGTRGRRNRIGAIIKPVRVDRPKMRMISYRALIRKHLNTAGNYAIFQIEDDHW